jgi:hypothetical protein
MPTSEPLLIEPEPYPESRLRAPVIRSRLMLQIASHMIGQSDWAEKQVQVQLRKQGDDAFAYSLLGGDSPKSILDVLGGGIDVALVNPATSASAALHRLGIAGSALASIATIPSYDQLALAVSRDSGITRLEELPIARPRLRVSLRDQRDHGVQGFIEDALGVVGVSLADILEWGGSVRYDPGLPHLPERSKLIRDGVVDAVFDEGVYNWGETVLQNGMRFLDFGDDALTALEERGYRRGVLTPQRFPTLTAPVATLDFSGFLIYTRADAPDHLVEAFCAALLAERDSIAWQGGDSLPLEHMVADGIDAPLAVPLHPAAARFWTKHGVLGRTAD